MARCPRKRRLGEVEVKGGGKVERRTRGGRKVGEKAEERRGK